MRNILSGTCLAATLFLGAPVWAQTPATPAPPTDASRMDEPLIATLLGARGYTDIADVTEEGEILRIGTARRFGERVENLRVVARTGEVADEAPLTPGQVRHLLEERGYSDVDGLTREGDRLVVLARQNEHQWRLQLDAQRGTVLQQQAHDVSP
ncbi:MULTISPECIES: hypothetical protein [Roseomonadaceae]|uniref:PepSY domain-containing protein n=1 Tax=Falsiroseomonas oleicola TaxID=2801474 RepID=A0ABS6H299_9PROT|nr:hypothetical protein [Roseomonas oleicola]MBU8542549.1 hypothetical protein [Roseomonas oleicola]